MKKIMISVILLVTMLLVMGGCHETTPTQPQPQEPQFVAELKLDQNIVSMGDSDPYPIKITLTQLKEFDNPPVYSIELLSPNSDYIYFQNSTGQRTEKIITQQFENVNDVKNYDIFIIGKIVKGQDSAKYTATIRLTDQNRNQIGQNSSLKIEVHK